MRSFLLPFVFALLTTSAAAQAADGVPRINFSVSCRASVTGTVATTEEFDACRRSEEAARQKLAE